MKSEKAKKVVEETSFRNNFYCNVPLGQCWTKIMHIYDVKTAIELAEQEAEERMREKALSAFDDMWFENGEDGEFEPDYEYHRRNFIQKLNEE